MAIIAEKQLWTAKVVESPIDARVSIVGECEKSDINQSYTEEDSTAAKASMLVRCAASTNTSSSNANISSSEGNKYTHVSNAIIAGNSYKTGHSIKKITSSTKKSYSSSVSRSSSGRGRGG